MRYIKGSELTAKQRAEVLSAFVYRNTLENPRGAKLTGSTMRPIPNKQWLAEYAFPYLNDGSRLALKPSHCLHIGLYSTQAATFFAGVQDA